MNSLVEPSKTAQSPDNLFAFEPGAGRVHFLDQRTRLRLADSLRYIQQQANGQLDLPEKGFEEFLLRLEHKPAPPLAFSFYNDAVLAIESDDVEDASRLLREMIRLPAHSGGLIISSLKDPQHDPLSQRYASFLKGEEAAQFEVLAPSPEAAAKCREQIKDAFALMDAGDPALAAEIRALLREIVLAAGAANPNGMTFDGASSFMLWGAIIINANRSDGALGMVQMLAHESAHNLLFGLSADECLVENSADELFPSPLRVDPRPMDGIYHATFVSARMHRAVKRLIESGVLSEDSLEKARKDLDENAHFFAKGIEVVRRHGKLTQLGDLVMQGAEAYMR